MRFIDLLYCFYLTATITLYLYNTRKVREIIPTAVSVTNNIIKSES